jgi:hypothetical protein
LTGAFDQTRQKRIEIIPAMERWIRPESPAEEGNPQFHVPFTPDQISPLPMNQMADDSQAISRITCIEKPVGIPRIPFINPRAIGDDGELTALLRSKALSSRDLSKFQDKSLLNDVIRLKSIIYDRV